MKRQKAQIKEAICKGLEELADDTMRNAAFHRKRNSLTYVRKSRQTTQKIDITLEHHPVERREAAAAVYPFLKVVIPSVDETIKEMTRENRQPRQHSAATLQQPIDDTSPKGITARWYIYQADSVPPAILALQEFLIRWTIPFLDHYVTPEDMCAAYDRGDERVTQHLGQLLHVVAAMITCGRHEDAQRIMEQRFGKPGPRKQYRHVFEYFERLLA